MHNAGWIILLVEITIQKYIYIYSDKLQYNCTVTRLYYITIQLYSDKAIEKTT